MKHAPVLLALAVPALLLAGCDRPQPLSVDTLVADPSRLHTLRAQCRAGAHDGAFCAQVAQADLRRFLSSTRRSPTCRPFRPASMNPPMATRLGRRTRHE
jgi:hypothetical protein